MATVFVVDPSLRRTQVKVTPEKCLRDILEEACEARRLDPNSYSLRTQNNKALDLSQQWRLSGLTPGAKLQLTQASRSVGVVSVALQTPPGDGSARIQHKFPSTTSVWQVLRAFEDGVAGGQPQRQLNFTQRAVASHASCSSGRLEYEQPVVQVLSRTLDSFSDLQKTLAQLGLNGGNVLLRLSYRSSGQPLEEAMRDIGQYFTAVDPVPAAALSSTPPASADVSAAPAAESDAGPQLPEHMTLPIAPKVQPVEDDGIAASSEAVPASAPVTTAVQEEPPMTAARPDGSEENNRPQPATNIVKGISVYRAPSAATPAAALHEDDPSTFEPSVDHAKAHQASLHRAGRNTRLLSDKELEEQEAARQEKLAAVKKVRIRVKYPDGSSIELTVDATQTASDLYATVRDTLAHASEPFELKYAGHKGFATLPRDSHQTLVKDFGFRGSVLVTLLWSAAARAPARQGPSLRPEYAAVAQDYQVQLATQHAAGEHGHRQAMNQPENPTARATPATANLELKMKKFLGLGKKK